MDKNTIIGLILIFGLVMGFSFYNNSKIKKERELKEQKLLEQIKEEGFSDTTTIHINDSIKDASIIISDVNENKKNNFLAAGPFYYPENEVADYAVETNVAKYTFASQGGYIKSIELKNIYEYTPKDSARKPLVLFQNENSTMSIDLQMLDQRILQTKNLFFTTQLEDTLKVTGNDKKSLSLRLFPLKSTSLDDNSTQIDSNSYIEYLYTFSANDYKFSYQVRFVNMSAYLYPNRSYTLDWNANLTNFEKNYEYEKNITTIYYMDNLEKVSKLNEKKSEKKDFSTELKWISYKQQFFTSIIIADSGSFSGGLLQVSLPDKNEKKILKDCDAALDFKMPNIDNSQFNLSLYFGPNQYKLLKQYDLNLERQVPLGWSFLLHWINRLAVIPIFNWLEAYGLSYGIIILILTIILKLVLFPVAYKTYLSSARMRVLKPEIEEITARYPKQEDAMKKQQATMALYRKAGINPMAGCLPMLLQMPILIAFFRFFPSAYELRQQPFLWAEDLSTYDSILDFSFNIPFYGDHVSLFTLLMTIATLVYTWLNNKLMSPAGGGDQARMMKIMMYFMPILFLGLFNSFPSALTYYYLLVNLITFLQMWIFRMTVNEKKIRQKIQVQMSKPMKKSKWQQRLEDLQKQQQQMQKNKR
ncbi:MAG TPA: membrane protein insertase YidC [Bacteroidales bacterium]|jgi:YidC/Oxa1 family membrane protein insertase|nr:membrane protein insertase YidC [Bacteroidales bacterium]HOS57461.1 membrane protein insertase YidC [Bacteroidales bacterium]HRT13195.1 membrane protein insertase YidC [Bacteroidales bacterium]